MAAAPPETTYQVWYCKRCDKACKIQPADDPEFTPACRCKNAVPGLRPRLVTQMHGPKRRPMQALTDEEARLRGLARKNRRVTVTFGAEIVEAWTSADADGVKRIRFIVTTSDGRRHVVDPTVPGVRIEAAPETTAP